MLPSRVIGCTPEQWDIIKNLAQSCTTINILKKWDWDLISECANPSIVRLDDSDFISIRKTPDVSISPASLDEICRDIYNVFYFFKYFYFINYF